MDPGLRRDDEKRASSCVTPAKAGAHYLSIKHPLHIAEIPPSSFNSAPVMNRLSSLAR